MNRALSIALTFLALSGLLTSTAVADLKISLYENLNNGMTVVELDGTIATTSVAMLDNSTGVREFSLGNAMMTNVIAIDHPPAQVAMVNSTFGQLTAATGSLDSFTFPALVEDTLAQTVSFTGAPGFAFTVKGTTFTVKAYATTGPTTLEFSEQKILLDIPWTGFLADEAVNFGQYDGLGADGVRILTRGDGGIDPPTGPAARPDLLIGTKARRLKGDNIYNKNKASRKQTVKLKGRIAKAHTAKVRLRLQNDGLFADRLRFGCSIAGEDGTRTAVFAFTSAGRKVITAQALAGRYFTRLAPGETENIFFRMKTERLWAGARSDRTNKINFICRSAGGIDRGLLDIIFRDIVREED